MSAGTETRNTLVTLAALPLGLALVATFATSLEVPTVPDHVLSYLLMVAISVLSFLVAKERVVGAWPAILGLTVGYLAIGAAVAYVPEVEFIAPWQCFSIAAAVGFGALAGLAFRKAQAARSLWSFALAIVVSGAAAGYATFPQANVMGIRQAKVEAINIAFADFNGVQNRLAGDRSESADLERWKALRTLALAMGHSPISNAYISRAAVDYDVYIARRTKGLACASEDGDAKITCLRETNALGDGNAAKELGPVDILAATLGFPFETALAR